MEEGRSAFKILTSKPKGKRPLGRARRSPNVVRVIKPRKHWRFWSKVLASRLKVRGVKPG